MFLIPTYKRHDTYFKNVSLQYTCGQEDLGGPPGCLQYYTGTTGVVTNYGYHSSNTATTTSASSTHLQNQNYQVCVRRSSGMCYICWAAWDTDGTAASFSSFGLSLSIASDADNSNQGTQCTTDYIVIPIGQTAAIAATTTTKVGVGNVHNDFVNYIHILYTDLH